MKEHHCFQRLHKRVVILSGNNVHNIQIDLLDTSMVKQFHLFTYFKKRILFRIFRLSWLDICVRECCRYPLETGLSEQKCFAVIQFSKADFYTLLVIVRLFQSALNLGMQFHKAVKAIV